MLRAEKTVGTNLRAAQTYIDQMRKASHPESRNFLCDQLEMLVTAYLSPSTAVLGSLNEHHFTQMEYRLLELVLSRPGETFTYGSILNAMYFDREAGCGCTETMKVFICRLRRKLANTNILLETIQGHGLRAAVALARWVTDYIEFT